MSEFKKKLNKPRIEELEELYTKILKYKYKVFRFVDHGDNVYEMDLEKTDIIYRAAHIAYFVTPANMPWI